jgi:hypothetical protein
MWEQQQIGLLLHTQIGSAQGRYPSTAHRRHTKYNENIHGMNNIDEVCLMLSIDCENMQGMNNTV